MRFLLSFLLFSYSFSLFASISIDPGVYNVKGVVSSNGKNLVLKINPKSRSECNLLLKGPLAEKLKTKKGTGLQELKIFVKEKINTCTNHEASLLNVSAYLDDEILNTTPFRHENNLHPVVLEK